MFYQILLILHIAAGFTALASGGLAFTAAKGRKLHNKAGLIYVAGMLGVGFTAFAICLIKSNSFLFAIGLFSTYMTLSGYRSLRHYKSKNTPSLMLDWLIWLPTLMLTLGFTGQMILQQGLHFSGMQPVLLIFMGILLMMLFNDQRLFRNIHSIPKSKLLRRHIGHMSGAYISTVTAFLVTNIYMQPAFIVWLFPTAIGVPFIIYFMRKYAPKKKTVRQAA